MAKKISQLTPASTLTGDELVALVQSGATKQAALSALLTYILSEIPTRREVWAFACSDLTTALTAGTNKGHMHAPYSGTIVDALAGLNTPQDSSGAGTLVTVDVNVAGTSILTTKITIDNNEGHSSTAATQPIILDGAVTKGQKITADIDSLGDGTAKGLTVYLVVQPD